MMTMQKKLVSAIDDIETAVRKINEAEQNAVYDDYLLIKAIKEQLVELANKLVNVV